MYYQPLLIANHPYHIQLCEVDSFPQHWHSELEILICTCGSFNAVVNNHLFHIHENEAVVILGTDAHSIEKTQDDSLYIIVEFGYAFLGDGYSDMQTLYLENPTVSLTGAPAPNSLEEQLTAIRRIVLDPQQPTPEREWMLRSVLFSIAAIIHRIAIHKEVKSRMNRLEQMSTIRTVVNYVERHYQEPISLDTATRLAGYDKAYFCKRFRKTVGMPFHKYLNYYRISVACSYLNDKALPIYAVAERSGFPSAKQFCRVFRDYMQMTPSEYRALDPVKKTGIRLRITK